MNFLNFLSGETRVGYVVNILSIGKNVKKSSFEPKWDCLLLGYLESTTSSYLQDILT